MIKAKCKLHPQQKNREILETSFLGLYISKFSGGGVGGHAPRHFQPLVALLLGTCLLISHAWQLEILVTALIIMSQLQHSFHGMW